MDDAVVLPLQQAPDAIELRHLRAFVAVARELSFSRAAEQLFVSQPALSRQVRALERLLGCTLLHRSTHRVELTLAGEALLARATELFVDLDNAVAATRSVGGANADRLAKLWGAIVDVTVTEPSLTGLRTSVEELHAKFRPPDAVEVRSERHGGVPVLRCVPEGRSVRSGREVLLFHGGGFVSGSSFGYRHLAGALCVVSGRPVIVPDIRLAPEHPFPAALDDAVAVYRSLLAAGRDPAELALAGDSSGAALVLAVLLREHHQGRPLPGRALLMSPWLDIAGAAVRADAAEPDGTALEATARFADLYLAGHSPDDPLIDLLGNDMSGLPPLLVQTGTGDALSAPESRRFADLATDSGVDVRLEFYPVDTHDFHLFWSFLPEASEALHRAGGFLGSAGATAAALPVTEAFHAKQIGTTS